MEINVTQFDGGLFIQPAPPYLLKFLKYSHREMKTINWKRECVFTERLLYTRSDDNSIFTLPGFINDVIRLIEKNLDVIKLDDKRSIMPAVDWQRIKPIKLRDYQVDLVLDMLFKGERDSGVMNATGGSGKTFLQMITYAAWNQLNTILAIPLKQVVLQTHAKFKEFFPDKHIGLMGGGSHDLSQDITITTFSSLKNCALEKCELLLVDEMQSAGQPTFQDCLKLVKPRRIFGYSATTEGLFNNTDKLLKGVFGEDLIYFPYEDAEKAGAVVPGVVYMVRMPDLGPSNNNESIETKFRKGIKNNAARNEIIGKVCSLIPKGWQTIVFIDHVKDHLIPMYKYMPKETRFLHRETSKRSVGTFALTPKQQNDTIEDFSNNKFGILIASDAFRAGVDIPNCRVVVQASGGSSKVEVLQEAYRGSRILTKEQQEKFDLAPKPGFFLIDIQDNHDTVLEGMAKKRIGFYKEQGWTIKLVNAPSDIDWRFHEKKL